MLLAHQKASWDVGIHHLVKYIIGDGELEGLNRSGKIVGQLIWNSAFNQIENISTGMYSNKFIEHDIVKRKINIKTFDYSKTFEEHSHLEDYSFLDTKDGRFKNIQESKRFFLPEHHLLFGDRESSNRDKVIQGRASQLQQINSFRLTITVDGDLNVRAGDVIYLEYPSVESFDIEDKMLSGKYLVVNVKNTISSSDHRTVFSLVKDSYSRDVFN